MHDPLSVVNLAACIYGEEFPQMDRGLRQIVIAWLQTHMSAIMGDEDAWRVYSEHKVLLKALHAHQCERLDNASGHGILTPLESPAKK